MRAQRGGDTKRVAITITAWNANALFHQVPEAATKRRAHLEALAKKFQDIVITETHGDTAHFEVHFPQVAAKLHICTSIGDSCARGGIAVLVLKEEAFPPAEVTHKVLVETRVLKVKLVSEDYTIVIYGDHIHGMSADLLKGVGRELAQDPEKNGDPAHGVVWVAGDWNYIRRGSADIHLRSPWMRTTLEELSTRAVALPLPLLQCSAK